MPSEAHPAPPTPSCRPRRADGGPSHAQAPRGAWCPSPPRAGGCADGAFPAAGTLKGCGGDTRGRRVGRGPPGGRLRSGTPPQLSRLPCAGLQGRASGRLGQASLSGAPSSSSSRPRCAREGQGPGRRDGDLPPPHCRGVRRPLLLQGGDWPQGVSLGVRGPWGPRCPPTPPLGRGFRPQRPPPNRPNPQQGTGPARPRAGK